MESNELYEIEAGASRDGESIRITKLMTSLHEAQAQGVLHDATAVGRLLIGIEEALANTIEGNAKDPKASWALQTNVYWEYFEMDIKENILTAFSGLDPDLRRIVQRTLEETLSSLKRKYWSL